MTHTIDNTLTANAQDELSEKLPLFAEMPGYMKIQKAYDTLKQIGKGATLLVSVGAAAYFGNKARNHYKNTRARNVSIEDPNKDIAWDIEQ